MSASATRSLYPGVSAMDQSIAYREISAMLNAGLSLDHALDEASHTGPAHFRRAMGELAQSVRNGNLLTDSMRGYGNMFHPVVPAIIQAGEVTGQYSYSFAILSEFFEKEAELKRTIQSAMVYPSIVVVVAIIAVGILAYIGFMSADWAVRLLWGVAAIAGIFIAMRFRAVQRMARYIAMMLPFFGAIMKQLAVARFCHTFGMLSRAGVPYLEGLEVTQPVIQHPLVEHSARNIYFGLRNGNTLEDGLRGEPGFPRVVRNMVATGEASGSVDEALIKCGDYLRQDAEYKIRNASKFAGPVMVIGMGIIVLLILLAFWQSYFDMIFSIME